MGLFDKFKKDKGEEPAPYCIDSDYEYNGIAVEVDNDEESVKHIGEDFDALQKDGVEKIIRERFIPWFKGEEFADKDDQKIFEGLRVFAIHYHYSRIIAEYSPTNEDGFFGQFEFDFESADDYTADMLEATAFEVYVQDGKIVGTDGYEI